MKQVKAEIIDLEYEEQEEMRLRESDEDALMVARKIKQELSDESSPTPSSPSTPPIRSAVRIIQENILERPAPLVFDHFICMRIGLNSKNNVQRLMALLTAHEFVDLTVLPTPSFLHAPIPPMMPIIPHQRVLQTTQQEASTSKTEASQELQEAEKRKIKKQFVRKFSGRQVVKTQSSADCGIIPINLQCKKCDEVIPKGAHGSTALIHVQKNHLKMAAFQCRICKHYRTTQERIQSHVTTVHKAKSTKFDSSLAGPLSAEDIRKMEEMITYCFPPIKMELHVTDRLVAKTMTIDVGKNSSS